MVERALAIVLFVAPKHGSKTIMRKVYSLNGLIIFLEPCFGDVKAMECQSRKGQEQWDRSKEVYMCHTWGNWRSGDPQDWRIPGDIIIPRYQTQTSSLQASLLIFILALVWNFIAMHIFLPFGMSMFCVLHVRNMQLVFLIWWGIAIKRMCRVEEQSSDIWTVLVQLKTLETFKFGMNGLCIMRSPWV